MADTVLVEAALLDGLRRAHEMRSRHGTHYQCGMAPCGYCIDVRVALDAILSAPPLDVAALVAKARAEERESAAKTCETMAVGVEALPRQVPAADALRAAAEGIRGGVLVVAPAAHGGSDG